MPSALQALIDETLKTSPYWDLPQKAQQQLDHILSAPTDEMRALLAECQHDPPCCRCDACSLAAALAEVERLRADIAEWKEGLEAPNATVAAYERGHTLSELRQLDSEVNRIKVDGEVRRKQGHNEAVGELVASFKNPEDQRVAEYAAILHERLAKLRGEDEPS